MTAISERLKYLDCGVRPIDGQIVIRFEDPRLPSGQVHAIPVSDEGAAHLLAELGKAFLRRVQREAEAVRAMKGE